jgi:hypothetical protein
MAVRTINRMALTDAGMNAQYELMSRGKAKRDTSMPR